MPLSLQVSRSLRQLARHFTHDLAARSRGVFDADYVVTQTEGMNNFLRLQLAAHTGIAANCKYLGPNEIILQAFRLLVGETQRTVSVPQLRWQLYQVLGSDDFRKLFPEVAGYYQTSEADSDLKRLELAEKVAVLFDQYQIYRPGLIRKWNRPTKNPDDWQHHLWQQVMTLTQDRLSDKTRMGDAILEALKNPDNVRYLQRHMPVVHVFGISIITDYHVSLLHALSGVIDVRFYLLDPAAGVYWYEDRSEKQLAILQSKGIDVKDAESSGNPLLTSWGRVVQDTFRLLFRHDAFLNAYEALPADETVPETLLQKIQDDIHNGVARADRHRLSETDLTDGSLTVQSCYTPLREVEAFYNYLMGLWEKNPSFSPQDVLVMVSDINTYAPYIKAVFDNAPYKFRYTLSDENPHGGDTLTDALVAILQLAADSFKPEEVAQLLEFSHIRDRFSLHDTALIRRLIEDANIRFGLDGDAEDDTRFVSWRYGLQRIVYGVCMQGDDLCVTENGEELHPLDCVEGSDAETAIRFAYFAEVLMQHLETRYRARSIADWVSYVERVINDLLADTGEEIDEELQGLLSQLGGYNAAFEYMPEPISYEVFSRSLLQGLKGASQSSTFGYGGITFCSMVPMRSVPFKIVALLGMDADKFPRRESVVTFNKMTAQREVGDRNVRDNDRHLFLETVLSAERYLYISYLGKAAKDNTAQAPSPLVEELLDYIEDGVGEEAQPTIRDFVVPHPLHSFSAHYNNGDPRLRDYLRQEPSPVSKWTLESKETEPSVVTEIQLGSLSRFATNALETWYRHRLGIVYDPSEAALSDLEMLNPDALGRSILKSSLLTVSEEDTENWRRYHVRNGALPLRSMSVVILEELADEVGGVKALTAQLLGDSQPVSVPVTVPLGNNLSISGNLALYDGGRLCFPCFSKSEARHRMKAALAYVLGVAAGVVRELHFVSQVEDRISCAAGLSQAEALKKLSAMATLYAEGRETPFVFTAALPGTLGKRDIPDTMSLEDFRKFIDRHAEKEAYIDAYFRHHYRQGHCATEAALESFRKMHQVFYEGLLELFA